MTQQDILQRVWRSLETATNTGSPFTLAFLGTLGPQGGPRVRAVILERFEQQTSRLYFATNAGSSKIREFAVNSQVALTMHDPQQAVQLRIEGTAEVVEDAAAREAAWESLAPESQQLYLSRVAPGTPLAQADTNDVDAGTAFERFAWIQVNIENFDWLDLSELPPIRWSFGNQASGWDGQRITS